MNENQIKIDTYKELIEWAEKEFYEFNDKEKDFQCNQRVIRLRNNLIAYLKGRIEELEK